MCDESYSVVQPRMWREGPVATLMCARVSGEISNVIFKSTYFMADDPYSRKNQPLEPPTDSKLGIRVTKMAYSYTPTKCTKLPIDQAPQAD